MLKSFARLAVFLTLSIGLTTQLRAAGFDGVGSYFSFHLGDGGLPDGIASSVGDTISPDGNTVKFFGQCGPITGAQFDYNFVLFMVGSYTGPINAGDTFSADLDFTVNVTGGDLAWNFFGDMNGGAARILTPLAPLPAGGQLSGAHLVSSPFADATDGAYLESYLHIDWTNYSPTDTLSITIPEHSIDVSLPEPASTGVAGLVMLLLKRRGRTSR